MAKFINISFSELRENLPDILARVQLLGNRYKVFKYGKLAFLLVPPSDGEKEPAETKRSTRPERKGR